MSNKYSNKDNNPGCIATIFIILVIIGIIGAIKDGIAEWWDNMTNKDKTSQSAMIVLNHNDEILDLLTREDNNG